jgi:hypothetical protein
MATTIEKSPRLHLMVMKKIEDVVRKDLASKVKATKPKTKNRNRMPRADASAMARSPIA